LEIGTKLGRAIGHRHYLRGWHVSATIGVFAAAASLARLQGMTPDQLATAWGIAGSTTSGLIKNFGTMTKPFHIGHAAQSAVQAVWLSRNGFSADSDIFDPPGGFFEVYGNNDGEPLADLVASLGAPWALMDPGLYTKGWPCCYCNHRPVAGLLRLMEQHRSLSKT
jgi:2-methylcitrate dehydratase PrpD